MLELEVSIPPSSPDFDFNNARSLPFLSTPSTPRRFGDYTLSAPTSPSRTSEFYSSFNLQTTHRVDSEDNRSVVEEDDFAFDFRSELEETSVFAEELFDGGKIKPLQFDHRSSPKKIISQIFSPRKKKEHETIDRGRERGQCLTHNRSRRTARSLSPCRASEYQWQEQEDNGKQQSSGDQSSKIDTQLADSSCSSKSSSRRWRFKDFLLFRSASEGRASDKEYKYPINIFRKLEADDVKSSSFRSTDSSDSAPARRKKVQVSAHELHYRAIKAASQDSKKKTYLPYKHGIFGR